MSKFLKIIKKQRDQKKDKKFKGTFLEYLELLEKNPSIAKTAHKRLYDAISSNGTKTLPDDDPRKRSIFGNENVQVYEYFDKEFFGMERVIEKIMRFLKGAALRGEESRQVLLLMGPVGAGK